MPQSNYLNAERLDGDDTMSAPRFNHEAARQARPVMPLPSPAITTVAQPRRRFKVKHLLPLTLIVGAAVIGATTGSVLWRVYRTSAAPSAGTSLSISTPNQPNQPFKLTSKESALPEAPPPPIMASVASAAVDIDEAPAPAKEVRLSKVSGSAAPRATTAAAASTAAVAAVPSSEATHISSAPVSRTMPRKQEARPHQPAESIAAAGAVRRRTIEPAMKERQTNDDEQKKQDREKNQRHETALPPVAQDAGEIRRVRELFEGQPSRRSTARRDVDRVTAIFEGKRQQ